METLPLYKWIDDFLATTDRNLVVVGLRPSVIVHTAQKYIKEPRVHVAGLAREQDIGTSLASVDVLLVDFKFTSVDQSKTQDRVHRMKHDGE